MTIEIIDRLKQAPQEPKGIQLIGCLQSNTSEKRPSFGCSLGENNRTWTTPFGVEKIERVFSQEIDGIAYDVMIVHRKNGDNCLFIGKWNDGVWTGNP